MDLSQALIEGKGISLGEALSTGGMVTGLGLTIVFSVLLILMIILILFKVIFYKDPAKQTAKKEKEQIKASPTDWYKIEIPQAGEKRTVEVYNAYKFGDVLNLKALKEERLRKEAHELKILEEEVKWLVDNEIRIEIDDNLLILNACRLAAIISVTHSIDIQALPGNIFYHLKSDMFVKDEALDAGCLVTIVPLRMLSKPKGDRLKEILLVIVFPKLLQ